MKFEFDISVSIFCSVPIFLSRNFNRYISFSISFSLHATVPENTGTRHGAERVSKVHMQDDPYRVQYNRNSKTPELPTKPPSRQFRCYPLSLSRSTSFSAHDALVLNRSTAKERQNFAQTSIGNVLAGQHWERRD